MHEYFIFEGAYWDVKTQVISKLPHLSFEERAIFIKPAQPNTGFLTVLKDIPRLRLIEDAKPLEPKLLQLLDLDPSLYFQGDFDGAVLSENIFSLSASAYFILKEEMRNKLSQFPMSSLELKSPLDEQGTLRLVYFNEEGDLCGASLTRSLEDPSIFSAACYRKKACTLENAETYCITSASLLAFESEHEIHQLTHEACIELFLDRIEVLSLKEMFKIALTQPFTQVAWKQFISEINTLTHQNLKIKTQDLAFCFEQVCRADEPHSINSVSHFKILLQEIIKTPSLKPIELDEEEKQSWDSWDVQFQDFRTNFLEKLAVEQMLQVSNPMRSSRGIWPEFLETFLDKGKTLAQGTVGGLSTQLYSFFARGRGAQAPKEQMADSNNYDAAKDIKGIMPT